MYAHNFGRSLLFFCLALCMPASLEAAIPAENENADLQNHSLQESPSVLLISSLVNEAEVLSRAAAEGVLVVSYDAGTSGMDSLLAQVKSALGGGKAASIAIAAHDYGEAKFYLTGEHTVSLGSTLASEQQRAFWRELGAMVEPGGRIDLLACNLAQSGEGLMLVAALEEAAGVDVAASTDKTGNVSAGGDWVLETENVDVSSIYFTRDRIGLFSGLLVSGISKLTAADGAGGGFFRLFGFHLRRLCNCGSRVGR